MLLLKHGLLGTVGSLPMKLMYLFSQSSGLKLIMDFVPNHVSDQHEWFQASMQNKVQKQCPI